VKNVVSRQYLLFPQTWRHSKFDSSLCKIRGERHYTAFVKVVEGSEIYNFPIYHFVHFYSRFLRKTRPKHGTLAQWWLADAPLRHRTLRARGMPAIPCAPYRGHAPRGRAPRGRAPQGLPRPEPSGIVPVAYCPATSYVSCLHAKQGERGSAHVLRPLASSSRERTTPPLLGRRPDSWPPRSESPAGAGEDRRGELESIGRIANCGVLQIL
jgi:hypothetical protein